MDKKDKEVVIGKVEGDVNFIKNWNEAIEVLEENNLGIFKVDKGIEIYSYENVKKGYLVDL